MNATIIPDQEQVWQKVLLIQKDGKSNLIRDVSLCFTCARDRMDGTCEAYPDGIPQEILFMKVDHHKAYKGDQGLQYVPVET